MNFEKTDRQLFVELFGPLVGLEDEWRAQGASEDEVHLKAFGFDTIYRYHVNVNTGLSGGVKERILEENDDYMIRLDRFGRRVKLCKGVATIPLPLEYPVSDMDSWLKIKEWFECRPERLSKTWKEDALAARNSGAVIVASIPGGFDLPRQLLGEERLCLACYEQPELIHEILNTVGRTAEQVLDEVSSITPIDVLSIHEDMAGKSGCLFGPVQIEEFISPYYRRICDLLSARGTCIFQQDSDGNMNTVIPAFLDTGLTCMYPMEPAAGMDIVQVRNEYSKNLKMMGGIDKHVLRKSQTDILKELEYKMQPAMQTGGMIFGLDHRIPNSTPIENYRFYVQKAREILGLEPDPEPGWKRSAF